MKMSQKQKMIMAEVHIPGDLQDAQNIVSALKKKKSLVVLKNGEQGEFYLEIKGEMRPIKEKELVKLEKEYRLIFFSFFPGQKIAEPVTGCLPDATEPEKAEDKKEEKKKAKKVKKEKN